MSEILIIEDFTAAILKNEQWLLFAILETYITYIILKSPQNKMVPKIEISVCGGVFIHPFIKLIPESVFEILNVSHLGFLQFLKTSQHLETCTHQIRYQHENAVQKRRIYIIYSKGFCTVSHSNLFYVSAILNQLAAILDL